MLLHILSIFANCRHIRGLRETAYTVLAVVVKKKWVEFRIDYILIWRIASYNWAQTQTYRWRSQKQQPQLYNFFFCSCFANSFFIYALFVHFAVYSRKMTGSYSHCSIRDMIEWVFRFRYQLINVISEQNPCHVFSIRVRSRLIAVHTRIDTSIGVRCWATANTAFANPNTIDHFDATG